MRLIVTDLDGTLLDHNTYCFDAAIPALEALRQCGIPLILATSKTRAEVELWRERLGCDGPFIVENGGAVFLPNSQLPRPPQHAIRVEQYWCIPIGRPYSEIRAGLRQASQHSGCRVRGFGDMSDEEVAWRCRLPLGEASLARLREYDEPFVALDSDRLQAVVEALAGLGIRCSRGGRFHHAHGDNDKAEAVRILRRLYQQEADAEVEVLGLGDGPNDAAFLREADWAVVMPSPLLGEVLRLVPRAVTAPASGPQGWCEAVLEWLEHC